MSVDHRTPKRGRPRAAIHDGSGGLAKAIAGSRINATMIGRKAAGGCLMKCGGPASRICCCGHEPERILSLPVVERPEEKREGNLSEVGCAVKERGRSKHTRKGCKLSWRIRSSQLSFLDAALAAGLSIQSSLIVEWTLRE
jgi:hypothetical protein